MHTPPVVATTRRLIGALLLTSLAACAPSMAGSRAGAGADREINAAEIARLGGATAWQVLEQSGIPLSVVSWGPSGASQLSRRGMSSVHLSENPLVILDGVRTRGVDLLHQIPSREIEHIRVLSGIDASTRYGVNAGGGAILIRSKQGQ